MERILQRDGVRIYLDEQGRGQVPIVFVHGWGCDHTFFEPQIEHFSWGHQVIALDQRGFGNSDRPPPPYNAEVLASDLAWVCETLGLERPLVVGHSMGGAVVVEFGARYPDRCCGVVSLDRAVVLRSVEREMIHQLTTAFGDSPDTPALIEQQVSGMVGPDDSDGLKRKYLGSALSCSADVLLWCLQGFDGWDESGGEWAVRNLRVPTLFIFSTFFGDIDRLQQLCPHVVIGRTILSGHFNHLTVPAQVNAMIDRFLETRVAEFLLAPLPASGVDRASR